MAVRSLSTLFVLESGGGGGGGRSCYNKFDFSRSIKPAQLQGSRTTYG